MIQPHERLDAVIDEKTFLVLIEALAADRRLGAERWESASIEESLEAATSWAEDSDFGARQGLSSASPWKKFATFLYCEKIYE